MMPSCEVAVAGDDVDEVVERAGAGRGVRVEQAALEACGVGEADGGGEALAERTGGDLDAVGVAVLGVARGLGAPGAERLEVVELEAVATEVELDVLGQRAVARREDEAVAADPVVVGRVAAHDLLEQQVCGGSEAHGRARVPVPDLLDRMDLKGDYSAARERLQKAIEVAPADQKNRALRVMAFSYAFEGKSGEAEKYEKQVFDGLMAKPDFEAAAGVANELARIKLESGDINGAARNGTRPASRPRCASRT